MNRVLPCTIKFNNYLLIMSEKTNIEKIDTYERLIEKLKLWEVSPQETWDLVQKIKFNTSKKTIWKMRKFHMYIEYRGMSLIDEKVLDKVEILANKSKLNGRAHMIEYFNNVKKYLPKRVSTIKKLVNSDIYKSRYKFFNTKKKFDTRLEIKNLEKLIADKRQDKYWDPYLFSKIEETVSAGEGRKNMNFNTIWGEELLKALR